MLVCLAVKRELFTILVFLFMIAVSLPQLDHHVEPWLNPVILPNEFTGAEWVRENIEGSFMAGIFGGELIMGMSGNPSVIGGDWAANANAPDQMTTVQEFYKTNNSSKAAELMKKYNATFAWFPSRDVYAGYGWIKHTEEKMNDSRFQLLYKNEDVRIYKLKNID